MDCFAALAMTGSAALFRHCEERSDEAIQPLASCFAEPVTGSARSSVIACDKREAFAQGSEATKQSSFFARRDGLLRCARNDGEARIASRSLSTGAHSRDPVARNDGEAPRS